MKVAPCTWVAAYQKSGTTWARFLVHHLCRGRAASSTEVDAFVPNMHANNHRWLDHLESGGILATHKRYDTLTDRYGPCVERFVHVVRHPADVILSEARFFCLTQAGNVAREEGEVTPERLQALFSDYLTVMLAKGESARHAKIGMGNWAAHADSWLEARAERPGLLVRYEDLKRDPLGEVARIAQFLELSRTEAELRDVVDGCSLAAMRRMQEQEVAARTVGSLYHGPEFDPGYALGLRFVGRGAVGDGLQLGPAALRRLQHLFGDTMAALGYRADRSEPVRPLAAPELVA